MNMQEFLTKLSADKALAEKMSKAENPDAAYDTAKEAGLTESYETFITTMKKLNEAAGEMNTEEIESITGGLSTSQIVTVASAGVSAVASSIAAFVSAT